MFAPLPLGFPKLKEQVDRLSCFPMAAPPEMEEVGIKLRKAYARERASGYQGLSRGLIRRLPYALWLPGEPHLEAVEPELVHAYWSRHLPEAVQQPRVAKRWLVPLFYVYCHEFCTGEPEFGAFALRIRAALECSEGPVSEWLRGLHAVHRWFFPDDVGLHLGRALIQSPRPLPESLTEMQLWAGFLDEPIAGSAFVGALRAPEDVLAQEPVIDRMKQWAQSEVAGIRGQPMLRYPDARVQLADGMVRPWLRRQPTESLRNGLLTFFIKHYGDPRLLSSVHAGHHWQGVSQLTIETVKRWLVGDTLRGFMRILQLTADDIWRFRERFWMAYYNQGVVDEAWLALGTQAVWLAKREFGRTEWAKFGALVSGAAADQSVLFLRIGHVVFMEWSHNGSLRACTLGDPQLPAMYRAEYRGEALRDVVSLDFHQGQNERPQLTHASSDRGTWQRKARDFIAHHTGVRLNDQAIIG